MFATTRPALVTHPTPRPDDPEEYLVLTDAGAPLWTTDAAKATPFASMREAARAAARLPGSLRAFGLPLAGMAHALH